MSLQKNTLESLLSEKKEILKLFVIATALAFSVGVLASLTAAQPTIPSWVICVIASVGTLVSLVALALDLKSGLKFEERLDAALVIDTPTNRILKIKGYRFSEDVAEALSAIEIENKSIFSEWESDPLVPKIERTQISQPNKPDAPPRPSYIGIFKVSMETSETRRQKAIKLLEEAVYFVLLEHLSTHLSTYFNDSDGDDRVTEYKREDIPGFLLKNRVLSLLSTPIEQRDVFLDAFPNIAERPKGELCSLRSSTGAMYSRFDLVLPKGSKILHSDTGSIRIDTKRLSIELECHYDGTSVAIPNVFLSQYIGTNPKSAACRRLQISLKCSIKPISLLSSAGWEHYRWLDSFRDTLAKKVDFETFKNEIHWAHIEPLLYSMRRSIKSEPKKKEPIEANSETA